MTPEQEEQVRRALADAAVARTSMPPDVADRLDDVLAELVTAREQGSPTADAGASEERRARHSPAVLVAAAVVCLGALGAPAVLRAMSSSDSGSASSAGAASTAADARGPAAGTASAPAPSAGPRRAFAQGVLPPLRLHRATLPRDVRRALATVPALASGSTGLVERQNRRTGCRTPPPSRDTDVVAVLLDGKPATLVVAPPRHGSRQARVYSCEDVSAPVATARVAAP